jgi:glucokinase
MEIAMTRHAVCLDLGGTNLKGGIVSEKGELSHHQTRPAEVEKGPEQILKNLATLTDILINDAGSDSIPIEGIGVSTPGIIDTVFGGLTGGAVNLPGWQNTPFMKVLFDKFHIPVFAHNDVTATALGEASYGAGVGRNHVIMASVGTGIGGGIIIGGKLYEGATGYAGEIGHIVTFAGGHLCNCGVRGCWEEYAALRGIMRTTQEHLERDVKRESSIFSLREKEGDLTPRIVFDAARNGDRVALNIVDEIGSNTAVGLGSLINIFDPDMVIIGGGIAEAGDIYLNAIKTHIPGWSLPDSREGVEIVLAKLGSKAGIFGASALVFGDINRYMK